MFVTREHGLHAVAVSRDGRWVITAGGNKDHGELEACEVETGIVKKFQGHSETITCINISRRLHATSERVIGFYSTHMELEYWQARGWSNQECFNDNARCSSILAKLEARSEWVDGEVS